MWSTVGCPFLLGRREGPQIGTGSYCRVSIYCGNKTCVKKRKTGTACFRGKCGLLLGVLSFWGEGKGLRSEQALIAVSQSIAAIRLASKNEKPAQLAFAENVVYCWVSFPFGEKGRASDRNRLLLPCLNLLRQ